MNSIKKMKIKYFVVFILILTCAFSIGLTNSRYSSGKKIDNEVMVATPVVEFESVTGTSFTNMLPGDTVAYNFNIKNTDGNMINEVAINYYIKLTYENNNLPLTYKIYDITSGTEVELPTTSDQTSLIALGYENIETHNYKIEFTWPISDNAESYANKQIAFKLDVYAEQVI